MKKLSKRTMMILAAVGIVIVLVAVGIVVLQPGGNDLTGTANLVISPPNPTVKEGNTAWLDVNATLYCNWYTSNAAIVAFADSPKSTRGVMIKGVAVGQATIEARCGLFYTNHVSTIVNVLPGPTATPTRTQTPKPPTITPTPTRTATPRPTATPTGPYLTPADMTVNKLQTVNYTLNNAAGMTGICTWSSNKGSFAPTGYGGCYGTLMVDGYTGVEGTGYVKVVRDGKEFSASITVR